jgi:hypothetical protein
MSRYFAVGNALGEGVVIRDGLLTSLTPEDQDGRWKWLRYSAATSPGNSGGPLLNARGQVIGVVIGKSQSENLNYALPIEHVLAAESAFVADSRFPMHLKVLRDTFTATYQAKFALPLPLTEFVSRLVATNREIYRTQRAKFLARSAPELFPAGRSAKLLAEITRAYCPMLVMQGDDRTWTVDAGSRSDVDLPDDGNLCTREDATVTMFEIERGKNVDPKFYSDPRVSMDLLLKGLNVWRSVGNESLRVTSLGAPTSDSEISDRFQRRWRLHVWAVPFFDAQIVTLSLPTPDGYAGMAQLVQRGGLDVSVDYLAFLADYFYVSYSGTFAQWREFLGRRETLPAALQGVTIERIAGDAIRFRSPRLDFDLPAGTFKIDNESSFQMQMVFGENAGKATWNIGAVWVSPDEDRKTYVGASRQPKPGKDAGKDAIDRWAHMLAGTQEFSSERGHDADYKKTWRRSAMNAATRPPAAPDPASNVLYEISSMINDSKLPREVDDVHERMLENLRVKER